MASAWNKQWFCNGKCKWYKWMRISIIEWNENIYDEALEDFVVNWEGIWGYLIQTQN